MNLQMIVCFAYVSCADKKSRCLVQASLYFWPRGRSAETGNRSTTEKDLQWHECTVIAEMLKLTPQSWYSFQQDTQLREVGQNPVKIWIQSRIQIQISNCSDQSPFDLPHWEGLGVKRWTKCVHAKILLSRRSCNFEWSLTNTTSCVLVQSKTFKSNASHAN